MNGTLHRNTMGNRCERFEAAVQQEMHERGISPVRAEDYAANACFAGKQLALGDAARIGCGLLLAEQLAVLRDSQATPVQGGEL